MSNLITKTESGMTLNVWQASYFEGSRGGVSMIIHSWDFGLSISVFYQRLYRIYEELKHNIKTEMRCYSNWFCTNEWNSSLRALLPLGCNYSRSNMVSRQRPHTSWDRWSWLVLLKKLSYAMWKETRRIVKHVLQNTKLANFIFPVLLMCFVRCTLARWLAAWREEASSFQQNDHHSNIIRFAFMKDRRIVFNIK